MTEDVKSAAEIREERGMPPATLPRVKSDEEIKQLIMDVVGGIVFCDWMMPEEQAQRMMSMVFMPLALMEQKDIEKLSEEECSMIYEYMEKAGPRSVNGFPGFFSMQYLNRADHDYFSDEMEKYLKLQAEFMANESNNE
jgi:hypothetical protein